MLVAWAGVTRLAAEAGPEQPQWRLIHTPLDPYVTMFVTCTFFPISSYVSQLVPTFPIRGIPHCSISHCSISHLVLLASHRIGLYDVSIQVVIARYVEASMCARGKTVLLRRKRGVQSGVGVLRELTGMQRGDQGGAEMSGGTHV